MVMKKENAILSSRCLTTAEKSRLHILLEKATQDEQKNRERKAMFFVLKKLHNYSRKRAVRFFDEFIKVLYDGDWEEIDKVVVNEMGLPYATEAQIQEYKEEQQNEKEGVGEDG